MPILPLPFFKPAVISQIRRMCGRLGAPNWMPRPAAWYWKRTDGLPQGFGPSWHAYPGMANLLWLVMDLDHPPLVYDGGDNPLYRAVIMLCSSSKLGGQALLDWASLGTLQEFHDALPSVPPATGNRLENAYPLLKILAKKRLLNANT